MLIHVCHLTDLGCEAINYGKDLAEAVFIVEKLVSMCSCVDAALSDMGRICEFDAASSSLSGFPVF